MFINISNLEQRLSLISKSYNRRIAYPISTAKLGMGELKNSYKTPRGWHKIIEIIGKSEPINSVFTSRLTTGEIYKHSLLKDTNQDWILSRIIRLSGLEIGYNSLKNVDSMQRYIYIHGTNEEEKIGTPCSHGCIRMKNDDIIKLCKQISLDTLIYINQ